MHHEATHEALAGEIVKAEASEGIHCRYCRSLRVFRVYRQGILQERVYPVFGIYPWKCKACGAFMLLRRRKRPKAKQEVRQE